MRSKADAAFGLLVALVTEPRVALFCLLFFGGGALIAGWRKVRGEK